MRFINSLAFAKEQDAADPLAGLRKRFHFPLKNGKTVLYFCGNSLGLQPVGVASAIEQELKDWSMLGVEGHLMAKYPWVEAHKTLIAPTAKLAGALPHEIAVMNSLTVNLHLLLVSFYRPTKKRFKIICEDKAFSSDAYALASQVAFHGFDPAEAIIELKPREGEYNIRTDDILSVIGKNANELALVMMGGVNYYTGQAFDMESITDAAHKAGAVAGFDLAHGIGNLNLQLHAWNVDFACWCSYKYLNAGPGAVGGIFVHERFANDKALPRFAGWWGHEQASRFKMEKQFRSVSGAAGWALSNEPVFSMAAYRASMDIFEQAGIAPLCSKRDKLTSYLEFVVDEICKEKYSAESKDKMQILTPRDLSQRGCQISLLVGKDGKKIFEALSNEGVIADWREPAVIRLAPVPLYNSFEDVYWFGEVLRKSF